MSSPSDFGFRDRLVDGFCCTCGDRIWPDCDMSAASIVEEFERHLRDEHGFTQREIDDEYQRTALTPAPQSPTNG